MPRQARVEDTIIVLYRLRRVFEEHMSAAWNSVRSVSTFIRNSWGQAETRWNEFPQLHDCIGVMIMMIAVPRTPQDV